MQIDGEEDENECEGDGEGEAETEDQEQAAEVLRIRREEQAQAKAFAAHLNGTSEYISKAKKKSIRAHNISCWKKDGSLDFVIILNIILNIKCHYIIVFKFSCFLKLIYICLTL